MIRSDDRRRTLATVSDPRVDATRARLIDAITTAAEEENDAISVTAICRAASVGRSTFYTHFATVEEVALAAIEGAFASPAPGIVTQRTAHDDSAEAVTRNGFAAVVDNLDRSRALVQFMIRSGSRAAMQDWLTDRVADVVEPILRAARPETTPDELRTLSLWMAAGTVRVAIDWVETSRVSADELIEHMMLTQPEWIIHPVH